MSRPLVYILTCLIIGILCGQHFYSFKYAALFIGAIFGLLAAVTLLKNVKIMTFLIVLFVTLGFLLGVVSTKADNKELYDFVQKSKKCDVICEVLDLSKEYDNSNRYIVKIQSVKYENIDIECSSKSILYTNKNLTPGDIICFNENISVISQRKNKTDFDAYSYYKSYNIEYKIYADELYIIEHKTDFNSIIKSIRNSIGNNFDKILPSKEASFMRSVILGDKADLDDDLYSVFRDGGVAHIIAISGLHITILAAFIKRTIGIRFKYLSYAAVVIFLAFYCVLTGLSPSAVRASVMSAIIIFGRCLGKRYDIVSSAALTCIIMLIYNSYNIYNIGFCYSFACAFGIGMAVDIIEIYGIDKCKLGFIFVPIIVSITANMFSKPITVYSFYYINTWDIISNIIIVPFMSFVFSCGITGGLLTYLSKSIGIFFAGCPYVLIHFYELVCSYVMTLPNYRIETGGIHILYVVGIYLMYIIIYNSLIYSKNIKYISAVLIVFLGGYLFSSESFVNYIDTDKGKAEIIIKNGNCTIIDCGSVPKGNYGKYRILKYLKYRNVKNINKIYVTETSYYTMGGILEIWDDISIDEICILNSCDKNLMYYKLVDNAPERNINITFTDEINDK